MDEQTNVNYTTLFALHVLKKAIGHVESSLFAFCKSNGDRRMRR